MTPAKNEQAPIRVLLVDDSSVVHTLVRRAAEQDDRIDVAGNAKGGDEALQLLARGQFDAVILDVEMPDQNGLQVLERIRAEVGRIPVVMFSSVTERGAAITLDALNLGANDYLPKPSGSSLEESVQYLRENLLPRLHLHARPRGQRATTGAERGARATSAGRRRTPRLLAIGTSTGGPNALATVLPELPEDLPFPVVVTQHMPPVFTRQLAARLDGVCALDVVEASDGDVLLPGGVWIAPGDHHMTVQSSGGQLFAALDQGPPENQCRPAVDPLLRTAVEAVGPDLLAVVLTGMGKDGLAGARLVREAGGRVFVQDQDTSVVWGMPGAIAKEDLHDQILPLDQVAASILASARGAQRRSA